MWAQTGVSAGLPRNALDFLSGAFGPLAPILPMPINEAGPDGRAVPRRWQFPVGWNLPMGQPGSEGLKLASFATLRSAADAYSVVRAMLNIRIQEMAGMEWDIGATPDAQSKTKGDKAAVQDQRDRASKVAKWFRRPDPNYYGFQSWFTALLEEQHVTDAISIYMHPTRVDGKGLFGTDLAALEAIDGTTIRPLLDINGAVPKPPNVAYSQYLWGVPRVDMMSLLIQDDLDEIKRQMRDAGMDEDPTEEYRADQLMYLPRFRRVFTPYGFGAIEQALMPLAIGMNRQQFLLNFFCYDDQTEVLTREGWRHFADLRGDEEYATRSPGGKFEWQASTDGEVHRFPFSGEMVRFENAQVDALVTPNHRMLVRRTMEARDGRQGGWNAASPARDWHIERADALFGPRVWEYPATSTWEGVRPETYVIEPAATMDVLAEARAVVDGDGAVAVARPKTARGWAVPMAAWSEFLGLFLAEGWVRKDRADTIISQSPSSPRLADVNRILAATPFHWAYDPKNGKFTAHSRTLAATLRATASGRSYEKRVPAYIRDLAPDLIGRFVAGYMVGDGTVTRSGQRKIVTTSRGMAGDLQELFQKMGVEARVDTGWTASPGAPTPSGRLRKGLARPIYVIAERTRAASRSVSPLSARLLPRPRYEWYAGEVSCVSVPNGIIYTRRNGIPMWAGNTEGTIPGVYVIAGDAYVTPAQQRQLQDTLNALAGDQAWKHRVIVLPPNSKTEAQKDMAWTQGVDQTIIEQVAMILHIQMQEISMLPGGKSAGLGGKGATEGQMESITKTRTRPDRRWWKETLFDWLIQQYFGQEDLEFKWVDFDEADDNEKKAQAEATLITAGKLSIDETRIEDGLDPWNTPFTSKPYVVVNNQLVSLDPTIAPYPVAAQPPAGGGLPGAVGGAPPFGGAAGGSPFAPKPKVGPDGKPIVGPDGKPVPSALGPDGKPLPPSMDEAHPEPPKQPLPGLPKPKVELGPDGKPLPAAGAAPGAIVAPDGSTGGVGAPGGAFPFNKPQHGPGEDPAKPNEAPATKPGERATIEPPPLPPHQRSPIDIMAEGKDKDPEEHNAPAKELVHEGADRELPHPDAEPLGLDGKPVPASEQADGKVVPKEPLTDDHFDDKGEPLVGGTAKPDAKAEEKPVPAKKMTVADIVKRRVSYKDSKLPAIVLDYLRRSYSPGVLDWVKDADWEFEPHVKLSDINMARRPGGRDPKKVKDISRSLDVGASMDPVVLVERKDQSEYKYDVADGWHRLLGAEDAKWDDVPAFIGSGVKGSGLSAPWGDEMQDASDSVADKPKAAIAELAVLRRFVRKGGLVNNFRTAALGHDVLNDLGDDLARGFDRDEAFERARQRVIAPPPAPDWLIRMMAWSGTPLTEPELTWLAKAARAEVRSGTG